MAASVLSEQARVELARAVLAHAELRTGARSVRVGTRPAEPATALAEGPQHGSDPRSTTSAGTPVPLAADPVRGVARASSGAPPTHHADPSTAARRSSEGWAPGRETSSVHEPAHEAPAGRVGPSARDGARSAHDGSRFSHDGSRPAHDEAPSVGRRASVRGTPVAGAPSAAGGTPGHGGASTAALFEAPGAASAERTGPSRPADEATRPSATRPAGVLAAERPPLPVPDRLTPLLPDGLRRGATTAVVGSTSLVLAMVAHACAGGAWAAVVGQPTVGLLAAAQAGVTLERLALVPRPGQDAATVVAALVDGIDVVLVGPDAVLTDTDRRRLSARARDRGAVLLSSVAWPGASTVLTVEAGRWWGVGAGDGRLRAHELRVTRSGRGGSAVPLSVDVTLPLSADVPSVPAATVAPEVVDEQPAAGLRLVG